MVIKRVFLEDIGYRERERERERESAAYLYNSLLQKLK